MCYCTPSRRTPFCSVCAQAMKEEIDRLTKQRDELVAALTKLSGMKLNMIADSIVDKALASMKGGT